MRTRQLLLFAIAGLTAGPSCVSRTTPLPPPEVSSVSLPNADGIVTVTGQALEGSSVGVINNSSLEGVITTPPPDCGNTCRFEAHLPADSGDTLRVWQFTETDGLQDVPVPSK